MSHCWGLKYPILIFSQGYQTKRRATAEPTRTIDQLDVTDVYRPFHPQITGHTVSAAVRPPLQSVILVTEQTITHETKTEITLCTIKQKTIRETSETIQIHAD